MTCYRASLNCNMGLQAQQCIQMQKKKAINVFTSIQRVLSFHDQDIFVLIHELEDLVRQLLA